KSYNLPLSRIGSRESGNQGPDSLLPTRDSLFCRHSLQHVAQLLDLLPVTRPIALSQELLSALVVLIRFLRQRLEVCRVSRSLAGSSAGGLRGSGSAGRGQAPRNAADLQSLAQGANQDRKS